MKSDAETVEEYVGRLPGARREAINKLRDVVKKNLPELFREEMNYGMIGYVVPLSVYPEGYLGNRGQPLPFMNLASQKNYIALYHMGLYENTGLRNWFIEEYEKLHSERLDMGKSCIRFKNSDHIPYALIGQLAARITAGEWVERYENSRRKKRQ